ncbi:MAG: hypothetical protein NTX04_01615 [Verrucomicrobia bacterium]|nr:hypothetical protein [Verrucomicrobiota bacterium]
MSILFWWWAAGPVSAYGAGMPASRHTPPKSELPPSAMPVLGATSGPAVCGRSLTCPFICPQKQAAKFGLQLLPAS